MIGLSYCLCGEFVLPRLHFHSRNHTPFCPPASNYTCCAGRRGVFAGGLSMLKLWTVLGYIGMREFLSGGSHWRTGFMHAWKASGHSIFNTNIFNNIFCRFKKREIFLLWGISKYQALLERICDHFPYIIFRPPRRFSIVEEMAGPNVSLVIRLQLSQCGRFH